jgi:hypothetical protein
MLLKKFYQKELEKEKTNFKLNGKIIQKIRQLGFLLFIREPEKNLFNIQTLIDDFNNS